MFLIVPIHFALGYAHHDPILLPVLRCHLTGKAVGYCYCYSGFSFFWFVLAVLQTHADTHTHARACTHTHSLSTLGCLRKLSVIKMGCYQSAPWISLSILMAQGMSSSKTMLPGESYLIFSSKSNLLEAVLVRLCAKYVHLLPRTCFSLKWADLHYSGTLAISGSIQWYGFKQCIWIWRVSC